MKVSAVCFSLLPFFGLPAVRSGRLGSQWHKQADTDLAQKAESEGANSSAGDVGKRRLVKKINYVYNNEEWVGGATVGGNYRTYPLEECYGDCDADADCAGNLKCFPREANEGFPNGCVGTAPADKPDADFCYDPSLPDASLQDKFRARLYWQDDYMWQETNEETFWCMNPDGPIEENQHLDIQTCSDSSQKFHFKAADSMTGRQFQVLNTNFCLQVAGTRNGETRLRTCNSTETLQRWVAGQGKLEEYVFDIRPIVNPKLCLSQDHHPKAGEMIVAMACSRAHTHNTAYWEKY